MIYPAFHRMADYFAANGLIEAEEKAIYAYGLQQGLLWLLNVAVTLLIGFLLDVPGCAVLFLASYMPLRTYAGGYHADTQLRCFLTGILLVSLELALIRQLPWTGFSCLLTAVFSAVFILWLAPVEDQNKPLNQTERKVYRKKAIQILLTELLFLCGLLLSHQIRLAATITISLAAASILVICGQIKNLRHLS